MHHTGHYFTKELYIAPRLVTICKLRQRSSVNGYTVTEISVYCKNVFRGSFSFLSYVVIIMVVVRN